MIGGGYGEETWLKPAVGRSGRRALGNRLHHLEPGESCPSARSRSGASSCAIMLSFGVSALRRDDQASGRDADPRGPDPRPGARRRSTQGATFRSPKAPKPAGHAASHAALFRWFRPSSTPRKKSWRIAVLIVAAGGIADGRGLAAAGHLMLGAAQASCWARVLSPAGSGGAQLRRRHGSCGSSGDRTIRSLIFDIARREHLAAPL